MYKLNQQFLCALFNVFFPQMNDCKVEISFSKVLSFALVDALPKVNLFPVITKLANMASMAHTNLKKAH